MTGFKGSKSSEAAGIIKRFDLSESQDESVDWGRDGSGDWVDDPSVKCFINLFIRSFKPVRLNASTTPFTNFSLIPISSLSYFTISLEISMTNSKSSGGMRVSRGFYFVVLNLFWDCWGATIVQLAI